MDILYRYLHASDCLLYNKPSRPVVVVASTVYQCLGAGCPIVGRASNFSYPFNEEILKYRDLYEMEENIIDVFEEGEKFQRQQKAIRQYLKTKSAGPVADQFIKLFKGLLKK